jgi:hypothetical protein
MNSGNFLCCPYHKPTDVIDVTLWASGLWLGTQKGAGGTVTIA